MLRDVEMPVTATHLPYHCYYYHYYYYSYTFSLFNGALLFSHTDTLIHREYVYIANVQRIQKQK